MKLHGWGRRYAVRNGGSLGHSDEVKHRAAETERLIGL